MKTASALQRYLSLLRSSRLFPSVLSQYAQLDLLVVCHSPLKSRSTRLCQYRSIGGKHFLFISNGMLV